MHEAANANQGQPQRLSHPRGVELIAGAARLALPLLQRLLPLFGGNVGNLLAAQYIAPQVNLKPVESTLADVQVQQNNLSEQVADVNAVLLQIQEQLEAAHEADERNAQIGKELQDELHSLHVKVNVYAFVILCLLGLSTILSALLFMHIRHTPN